MEVVLRYIPLKSLKGVEILAQNIINANKQVLMREGTLLNIDRIARLLKTGIKSAYIKDPQMDAHLDEELKDVIDPETRQSSIYNVKNCFERFDSNIKRHKKSAKYGDEGILLFDGVKNISSNLIDEILNSKNPQIAMMDIKNITDYHYEHSVNVAVLSLLIGVEMGLSLKELEDLAYGAIMIDIGNSSVDKKILYKEEMLSEDEIKEVKKHVKTGYDYLNDNTTFNAHVKNILLQHHERIDGSGYPNKMHGKDISKLAKIVMVADVYDAMTSDRSYRDAFNQSEVTEYIMANAGECFDFNIANIFVRKVVIYPVGCYVLLSNNQKGLVLQNNKDYPLRPKIRTFGNLSHDEDSQLILDLKETKNIVITKVIHSI